MRIQNIFLVLLATLYSCDKKIDNEIDCQLFDPAFETVYIKFLDSEGTNLITNGTYRQEDIDIIYEGSSIGFISNNHLVFETIGNQETIYTIVLNNTTMDKLILDVSRTLGLCDITFYSAESALYNNEEIVLIEVNDYIKLINVFR